MARSRASGASSPPPTRAPRPSSAALRNCTIPWSGGAFFDGFSASPPRFAALVIEALSAFSSIQESSFSAFFGPRARMPSRQAPGTQSAFSICRQPR